MGLDLRPDKYRVNGATGMSEPIESTPYVRMVALGRPTIYLQAGVYYFESGEIVPKDMLKEYGLVTDFTKESPRGLEPHPEVVKIIEANHVESLHQAAYRLVQGAPVIHSVKKV